jgi:hypothetical protein
LQLLLALLPIFSRASFSRPSEALSPPATLAKDVAAKAEEIHKKIEPKTPSELDELVATVAFVRANDCFIDHTKVEVAVVTTAH